MLRLSSHHSEKQRQELAFVETLVGHTVKGHTIWYMQLSLFAYNILPLSENFKRNSSAQSIVSGNKTQHMTLFIIYTVSAWAASTLLNGYQNEFLIPSFTNSLTSSNDRKCACSTAYTAHVNHSYTHRWQCVCSSIKFNILHAAPRRRCRFCWPSYSLPNHCIKLNQNSCCWCQIKC